MSPKMLLFAHMFKTGTGIYTYHCQLGYAQNIPRDTTDDRLKEEKRLTICDFIFYHVSLCVNVNFHLPIDSENFGSATRRTAMVD
jgi:hypothetical protein